MNNPNIKQNLVKLTAIVTVVIPTILLQAQSSQAIPLDPILDSAAKAFVQRLLGLPVDPRPEEPRAEVPAAPENPIVTDPVSVPTDTDIEIIGQN
jgi:hypothetical protein